MNKAYILGIDQSTTGTKSVIIDQQGQLIGKKTKEHKQFYHEQRWVEHDPEEILRNVLDLCQEVIKDTGINEEELVGVSITNQRETILLWDAISKKPLCNAFVWQCRRGSKICEELNHQGLGATIEAKTGLKLDTYFSASKIKWALDHVEAVKEAKVKGSLRIGTLDSWLIFSLTQGSKHVTDHTNASHTMLFNIHTLDWVREHL